MFAAFGFNYFLGFCGLLGVLMVGLLAVVWVYCLLAECVWFRFVGFLCAD